MGFRETELTIQEANHSTITEEHANNHKPVLLSRTLENTKPGPEAESQRDVGQQQADDHRRDKGLLFMLCLEVVRLGHDGDIRLVQHWCNNDFCRNEGWLGWF